jgi:3-deoxy-D-manno-octulosonic-acid transferase
MRGTLDRDHLLKLGVDEAKTQVTGNIKFDAPPPSPGPTQGENAPHPSTVVFGSTRPGEEKIILEAIRKLQKDLPDLTYVIAPRHVQRCQEVEKLIQENGLNFKRHSERDDKTAGEKASLILVDQLGALNSYYQNAAVAFVGGGLAKGFGGHNILEPAAHHLPVLFGKYMNNFAEEARLLKESGGGIELSGPEALAPTLHRLLTHPDELKERGDQAAKTIAENQGALARNMELIEKFRSAPES